MRGEADLIPSSRLLRCYAVTDPRGGQAGAVSFPLAAPAHTSMTAEPHGATDSDSELPSPETCAVTDNPP